MACTIHTRIEREQFPIPDLSDLPHQYPDSLSGAYMRGRGTGGHSLCPRGKSGDKSYKGARDRFGYAKGFETGIRVAKSWRTTFLCPSTYLVLASVVRVPSRYVHLRPPLITTTRPFRFQYVTAQNVPTT